jgi:hypothetical protein
VISSLGLRMASGVSVIGVFSSFGRTHLVTPRW